MIDLRILLDEDVICEETLRNYSINEGTVGYQLKNRIAYYSSLPVSSIKDFKLTIDGKKAEKSDVSLFLDNKCFSISQLPELYTNHWYSLDKAELIFNIPGGLSEKGHKIELKFELKKRPLYISDFYNILAND